MRSARIYYKEYEDGILTETDDGLYIFQYHPAYVKEFPAQFICFSMPVTDKPYKENSLFPFFEGLIPEGWLLDIAATNWKINKSDRMALLLACCSNCIGAVSVQPITSEHE